MLWGLKVGKGIGGVGGKQAKNLPKKEEKMGKKAEGWPRRWCWGPHGGSETECRVASGC